MGTNDIKFENEHSRRRAANRRNMTMSYVVIAAIVVAFLALEYVFLSRNSGFSFMQFLEEVAGNLMGVLAAFLIFDIIHDKLAKEAQADEISEHILKTLLEQDGIEALNDDLKRNFISGSLKSLDYDPEASEVISETLKDYLNKNAERSDVLEKIEMYSFKQRKEFIHENVKSLIGNEDACGMIGNFIDHYIQENQNLRIRSSFEYNFELRETLPKVYGIFKHCEDYFFVEETLTFQWVYLTEAANNLRKNRVSIAFAFNNQRLDALLRDSDCIFTENLEIHKDDVEYFVNLDPQERMEQFVSVFKPHLSIDGNKGQIVEVRAEEEGLVVIFEVEHDQDLMSNKVDIVFDMPQKWDTLLEVALTDPTKDPKITMHYPGDHMKVEMYSFLSESKETTWEEAHIDDVGLYRIMLNDTWVFP